MGARGKNFYNDIACRYGYEDDAKIIQDLYLDGRKDAAAAAVPDELVRAISLIGPERYVRERVSAFAESGATTVNVKFLHSDSAQRVEQFEKLRAIIDAWPGVPGLCSLPSKSGSGGTPIRGDPTPQGARVILFCSARSECGGWSR